METRLKEFRKLAGLSQEELAEKLSISKYQIRTYEQGIRDMPVSTMIMFCEFFHCTTDTFLKTEYAQPEREVAEGIILDDDEKDILELWRGMDEERRKDLLLLLNRWQA